MGGFLTKMSFCVTSRYGGWAHALIAATDTPRISPPPKSSSPFLRPYNPTVIRHHGRIRGVATDCGAHPPNNCDRVGRPAGLEGTWLMRPQSHHACWRARL